MDRDLARSFGLDRVGGALISQVQPDSPAAKAGLSVGDVIIEFDETKVRRSADLPHLVGRVRRQTKVQVELVRRGERMTLNVEVGRLPEAEEQNASLSEQESSGAADRLGLVVAPLEDPGSEAGAAVSEVDPKGAAAEAGLQPGDVVTQLGFDSADSAARSRRLVPDLADKTGGAVRFLRGGQPSFRGIRVGPSADATVVGALGQVSCSGGSTDELNCPLYLSAHFAFGVSGRFVHPSYKYSTPSDRS